MSTTIERYVIRHISGTKASQVEEFDFNKQELSIGRTAGSDIQYDPEQEVIVSREHGKIVKVTSDPPQFSINDNNSRNGIFVNKVRVKGSSTLNPGDEVQLGSNGPVFAFDIYPRPQNMMMETKIMDIPTSIKATTISEIIPGANASSAAEAVKTGLGKQTVERMLVAERKKSYGTMGIVIGVLIVALGVLGYVFRDNLFGKKEKIPVSKIKSPEQIAKENTDKVVQIEFGWQLFDANSGQELWHQYMAMKDQTGQTTYRAVYIVNNNGEIEPYLDLQKNVQTGVPLGIAGASGSGFVVSEDGFILTNRHVAASWNTRYGFPEFAFPGVLIKNIGGKNQIDPEYQVMPEDVGNYVPATATMIGGRTANEGSIKGENTYMNVIFANTALRRPVQSSTPSDQHDVAMIKVELPTSLSKVSMKDNYDNVKPGQTVTVMGYPGVAPDQYVVRKSNDPFNRKNQITTIPTPTVTTGNIGRIIPASSDKTNIFSGFGDSYQLTINATGAGNSGGPMFDDEGNVIGIYYAGKSDARGTQISFSIPIKYGMELMGVKKVQ
jgi:pSer/pThr/pTyr-binding forkhead associated (FHA) protein